MTEWLTGKEMTWGTEGTPYPANDSEGGVRNARESKLDYRQAKSNRCTGSPFGVEASRQARG